ncbi:MAG: cation-translocating P-type ATPase [Bacillota bacterium]
MSDKKWYSLNTNQVAKELNSNVELGLDIEETRIRLETYGPNTLNEPPSRSILAMFISQLKEVLVLILIIAAIVSSALGEWADAIVIMIIVILNAALGVFQENKAEQALKALKDMTKNFVKVIREGQINQIEADKLVPGDVVLLEAGDSIPADGRLIEAVSLMINESALTGESVPGEKDVSIISEEDVPVGDQKNMVFMGTNVTGGRGKFVVTGTGMKTEIGRIAQMLQETPPEPTPLQRQLADFGKTLGIAAGIIVAVVFLTGAIKGENLAEMFIISIALAVAAIPEGLPSVVTIVLALGVTRMSKRNAVIRKLPAVETLGVATYICTDKTGTLTKNEMTVTKLYINNGLINATGTGYQPEGEFFGEKGEKVNPVVDRNLELLLLGGALNSDAQLKISSEKGYQIIGDPTEGALVVVAAKAGLKKEEVDKEYPRLGEIPFDSDRKMMSTFHRKNGIIYSFTKGAPDEVLAQCDNILTVQDIQTMTEEIRSRALGINSHIASQGQRVLALAMRRWSSLPPILSPKVVEQNLTFVGYFIIQDPPRQEAREAIAVSREAGIKTVMITGDHQDTALAIAKQLDIWHPGDNIITGTQLEKISAEELIKHVTKTTVYARVSPEHKLKIISALKANNQVVAMTGDGVNDAPALKRADIGASMGITGTEVAKEASDMVLLDDNFATIVNAVEEGRTIYSNIRKSVQYLLSCNIGEIVAIFTSIILGLGSPLTPIQILWLNLVTDGPPALALGLEPPENGVMKKPPRSAHEGIFSGGIGWNIFIQGIMIGLVSLISYWIALSWGRNIKEAHTMAFLTMALTQLIHSFSVRSLNQSLFKLGIFTNKNLLYAFFLSVLLQLIIVFIPFLRGVFETTLLPASDWAVILGLSLIPLVIVEIKKIFSS